MKKDMSDDAPGISLPCKGIKPFLFTPTPRMLASRGVGERTGPVDNTDELEEVEALRLLRVRAIDSAG